MNNNIESKKLAVQDFYPENLAHCYGCGRLNDDGLQIKTVADGNETVTKFTPRKYHTAIPGYVYGGLIASLIDCHGTGSAAIFAYQNENRNYDSDPPFRFVTASLKVNYLKPTPIDAELELRGKLKELKGKKVVVDISLSANGNTCATGEVVAVQMPDSFK